MRTVLITTMFSMLVSIFTDSSSKGQTYDLVRNLYNDKINNSSYSTLVRPLLDQTKPIHVSVFFEIISIVEVNDVLQSITLNGFVNLNWTDELLVWNPDDYNGVTNIHPNVEDIWKPRLMLINTLAERDPLGDSNAPLFLYSNGEVTWFPGGIFSASCSLDMTYFPFDEQECFLYFYSMKNDVTEMELHSTSNRTLPNLNVTAEWELVDTYVEPELEEDCTGIFPSLTYKFVLRRRPTSFMITVMMPVCFLSFINFFAFVIPVSSGEKVTYGITLLLAQSVYMTTLTNMLPRSSGNLPRVTIYVFCLLIISAFNVLVSIATLFVYKMETKPNKGSSFAKSRTVDDSSEEVFEKRAHHINLHQFRDTYLENRNVDRIGQERKLEIFKYRAIKWISLASLFVSCMFWITVNMWFFLGVSYQNE